MKVRLCTPEKGQRRPLCDVRLETSNAKGEPCCLPGYAYLDDTLMCRTHALTHVFRAALSKGSV